MSDAEFRKYERAVNEGDIDAIPQLITASLRTNTPIHKYLPTINDNLNQNVIRTLEGSELMDLRLYRVHSIPEAAAILERSGRVLPSLEIIALNHEITGFAGKENSDILMKESIVRFDVPYFVRASHIFRLAHEQGIRGTHEELIERMSTYQALTAAQIERTRCTRSISQILQTATRHELSQLYELSQLFLIDQ